MKYTYELDFLGVPCLINLGFHDSFDWYHRLLSALSYGSPDKFYISAYPVICQKLGTI